jgi:flavin reductase (DIM6/NTAB) family NADH-FMN oxidoreductase RutF
MLDKPEDHRQKRRGVAPSAPDQQTRRNMSETLVIPGPDTHRAYRDALGCFGTGITIITAMTPEGPLAMTANSFASVSLDPAMVLWCAAKRSQRYQAFAAATYYAIHILAEDQRTLALHFARSGLDFDPVRWQPNPEGVPILSGCLARLECRQNALHDAGDHTIIVGEVLRAAHRPGHGLIHKRGRYGVFSPTD